MTEDAKTPHKKTKKSATIWVLSAISLAYIGIVYVLIKETEPCKSVAISANWFKGFWDQYLGCRSVNELGDTLAGAFAPVAFLWLMGAVFIQSQELKAQREELDETQEVMRAQLEVARQQVDETRKSTDMLLLQTEVLKEERAQKEAEKNNRIFDETTDALKKSITRANDLIYQRKNTVTGVWEYKPLIPNASERASLHEILDDLTKVAIRMLLVDQHISEDMRLHHGAINVLCDDMRKALALLPSMSEEMRIRAKSMLINIALANLEQLLNKIPDLDNSVL